MKFQILLTSALTTGKNGFKKTHCFGDIFKTIFFYGFHFNPYDDRICK